VNVDNFNGDFLILQIFPYKTGLIFYKLKINYVIDKELKKMSKYPFLVNLIKHLILFYDYILSEYFEAYRY